MNPYPEHGYWCGAKTYRRKCPGCQRKAFFFSCDCGSKVFFDELGAPWPKHDCEYQDMLDFLKWYAENWREIGLTVDEAALKMSQISQGVLSPAQCKAALLRAIKKKK